VAVLVEAGEGELAAVLGMDGVEARRGQKLLRRGQAVARELAQVDGSSDGRRMRAAEACVHNVELARRQRAAFGVQCWTTM
jgi:hypothetical protein